MEREKPRLERENNLPETKKQEKFFTAAKYYHKLRPYLVIRIGCQPDSTGILPIEWRPEIDEDYRRPTFREFLDFYNIQGIINPSTRREL